MTIATETRLIPLNYSNITLVPSVEGVYELANSSQQIIYIGRSDNLQRRLNEHLNTTDPCIKSAAYFRFEKTYRSEQRERELIDHFRRLNGRLPRCNNY